jgi:hypothetical protein
MDGSSRNGERTMNVKRILALATCAALAIFATPAANASTTATGTITVKWNTQAIGSMTMVTDYNATGQAGSVSSQIPTIFTATNGGTTGACTATGAGVPATSTTADFSNVTPDAVDATGCLYKNAVNGVASTSDTTGWNVAVSATVPAGFLLCLLPNGTYANNLAVTPSVRAVAVSGITTTATTCTGAPGNGFNMASGTLLSVVGASTTATNFGGDIELVLGPNAASGVQSVVVTYTLTMT